jgi:hypothetical protein
MDGTFRSIEAIFPEQSYFYANDTAITYSTLPSNKKTIDAVFEHLASADPGTGNWFVLIDLYGGVANKAETKTMPYHHQDLAYFFALCAISASETAETTHKFAEEAILAIQDNKPERFLSYAGYTNIRIEGNTQKKYWGVNFPRLENIKAAIDPKGLFLIPQGVKPSS